MTSARWTDLLHEQPWPDSQRLTEQQAERIEDAAGTLDLNRLVEDFTDYWQHCFLSLPAYRLKTWVLPLRLKTWIRNAHKRQPVAEHASEDRSDEYLRSLQADQRARGNR